MFTKYGSLLQNVFQPSRCLTVLAAAFFAIGISGCSRGGLTAHEQSHAGIQAAAGLGGDGASAKGKRAAAGALQSAADEARAAADEMRAAEEERQTDTDREPVMDGDGRTGTDRELVMDGDSWENAERKRIAADDQRPRIAYDEQDYEVMLKIVQAEAGGCDSTGKILVANVIMNRVESSGFPDDITSVVYERSQFTPVSSGAIDRVQVTEETVECVDRALRGEDHSQGALYFMNRRASGENAQWFDRQLTFLFSHDGHEFFK